MLLRCRDAKAVSFDRGTRGPYVSQVHALERRHLKIFLGLQRGSLGRRCSDFRLGTPQGRPGELFTGRMRRGPASLYEPPMLRPDAGMTVSWEAGMTIRWKSSRQRTWLMRRLPSQPQRMLMGVGFLDHVPCGESDQHIPTLLDSVLSVNSEVEDKQTPTVDQISLSSSFTFSIHSTPQAWSGHRLNMYHHRSTRTRGSLPLRKCHACHTGCSGAEQMSPM